MASFHCLPNGVFNRWCYDSQKHILKGKGRRCTYIVKWFTIKFDVLLHFFKKETITFVAVGVCSLELKQLSGVKKISPMGWKAVLKKQ